MRAIRTCQYCGNTVLGQIVETEESIAFVGQCIFCWSFVTSLNTFHTKVEEDEEDTKHLISDNRGPGYDE